MNQKIKASVFIATSLDGYIARFDGGIDWLENANAQAPAGEDFGYNHFFESVDTLVMGRNTFEKVLSFEPWPYGTKKVVVLSKTLTEVPQRLKDSVTITSLSPRQLIDYLQATGSKHVYIDGGKTIQSFLGDHLINEITVTRIPVLIGQGLSLFGNLPGDILLKHIDTVIYSNGFIQSKYSTAAS